MQDNDNIKAALVSSHKLTLFEIHKSIDGSLIFTYPDFLEIQAWPLNLSYFVMQLFLNWELISLLIPGPSSQIKTLCAFSETQTQPFL